MGNLNPQSADPGVPADRRKPWVTVLPDHTHNKPCSKHIATSQGTETFCSNVL